MECKHNRIRCTNNVFYCVICGAQLPNPYDNKAHEEKPAEAKKTASKRKQRKVSEAE